MDIGSIDYYIALGVIMLLAVVGWKHIWSAAKGGNSHLQWYELLQLISLLLFIFYSLRIIFLDQVADGVVFAAFLAGAGIGGAQSLADKKLNDKNS